MDASVLIASSVSLAGGGLVGVILGHRRGVSADLMSALSARLTEVETELKEQRDWRRAQENRYSILWKYCRGLIDYAYRHRREGSPDIPDIPDDLA